MHTCGKPCKTFPPVLHSMLERRGAAAAAAAGAEASCVVGLELANRREGRVGWGGVGTDG